MLSFSAGQFNKGSWKHKMTVITLILIKIYAIIVIQGPRKHRESRVSFRWVAEGERKFTTCSHLNGEKRKGPEL